EKDHLLVLESIDTEVYSEDKEPNEVDNRNLIEQLSINSPPQLEANLNILRNQDEKKDSQKFRRCLPSEDEWRLVEELTKIFELFDQATE
ncbi:20907_t:CDS:2, partial [Racocetra persica]